MERLVCDIYGVETRLLTASSRFLVNGVLIESSKKKAAGKEPDGYVQKFTTSPAVTSVAGV
jgi:hypothetical protein